MSCELGLLVSRKGAKGAKTQRKYCSAGVGRLTNTVSNHVLLVGRPTMEVELLCAFAPWHLCVKIFA